MFMEPTPTAYDLRWTMFGIPIRVHPTFWLFSVFLGWNSISSGLVYLLIWVACAFVSILIHELGHIFMRRYFGSHGHIVLYGMGGLAIGNKHLPERKQRILVSAAGPFAGFAFLIALLAFLFLSNPRSFPVFLDLLRADLGLPMSGDFGAWETPISPLVFAAVNDLIFLNLFWGLVNLLPVWPLDGGMISRELCEAQWGRPDGLLRSLMISIGTGGVFAVHCLMGRFGQPLLPIPHGGVWAAIMFALLAYQSYQLYEQAKRGGRDPWDISRY